MAMGVTVVRPNRPAIRARRSAAAFRENVSTRMLSGVALRRSIRSTTHSTRVVVLPVPGPASTSSGPPACSTTARWAGSSTGGVGSFSAPRVKRYIAAVLGLETISRYAGIGSEITDKLAQIGSERSAACQLGDRLVPPGRVEDRHHRRRKQAGAKDQIAELGEWLEIDRGAAVPDQRGVRQHRHGQHVV